jgi:hypothetical protein
MAIDKESSGIPEVDFRRPSTKVNLAIIVAGAIFFAITFGLVIYFMRGGDSESNSPSPPTETAPAEGTAPASPNVP